ncbi:lytic transglycosylase F [Azonexus hydrophilus]|uniref:Lytic transglycosylase F n=1 Tax=Azonexus hydrophilus TaxID=418702 RepID=A0A1R1I197_9RHOO|nr:membrane-bound lytic murein transglycosylase MltF [Azonexus hydrophilus]OMG52515.1 lytic transglycosylase F [Azonexus hydrophilus]
MPRFNSLFALLLILLLTGCGEGWRTPLPFPTPGKQDLVVLTRPGPLTYSADEAGTISGLEYDLVTLLAEELGVRTEFVVLPPGELNSQLLEGRYHIAAAWLSPSSHTDMQGSPPIFSTRDVLAQHEGSLPLTSLEQLAGKTVHALAGSRQAATIRRLAAEIQDLTLVEVGQGDILDLLDSMGDHKVSYVAMDGRLEDLANQHIPTLRTTLTLSDTAPITWWLGKSPNPEVKARVDAFIERVRKDGTLARLEERYFGHVRRLKQIDIEKFFGQIETTLPKLRKHFQDAERITGIDWRLIAALAYQESHWDPFATSYTNVRGMMMLTEETADRLGVSNRLDARESIIGGARYLNILKDTLPADVEEPDRTWLALAGYNIGPGHLNAARTIGRQLKANPNAWYDMKRVLPLLAKPQYYNRLKSGRARGGEAVILVENIRSYYDILTRNEAPLPMLDLSAPGEQPGLKLRR